MFEKLLSRRGLSFDRLRNFASVVDSGSISRVADGDPVRQSQISRQIGELEEFFGIELMRRRGKGLEATEAGIELARQIRISLQGLEDFQAAAVEQPLEYRFAAGNSVIEWLVVPKLAELRKRIPGLVVHLFDERSRDVVAGLMDHCYDFGVLRKTAVKRPLRFRPLRKIGYALFVPRGWAVNSDSDVFGKLPLAATFGGEFLEELENAASAGKKDLRVTHYCASFTQAARLVQSGAAAAVLPDLAESDLAGHAKRVELPWLAKYKREIGVAWHARLIEIRPKAREVLEWISANAGSAA
jgi:DNA-binding transcriptional LysR family regulator